MAPNAEDQLADWSHDSDEVEKIKIEVKVAFNLVLRLQLQRFFTGVSSTCQKSHEKKMQNRNQGTQSKV